LKKPQAIIGLLAALGTAIGVLVAVIGLPYGRADYSAFAESYHGANDFTGLVHVSVDSDISNGINPSDANVNCVLPCGGGVQVDVTVGNDTGAAFTLGTFNFDLVHLDDSRLDAPAGAGTMDSNPDFTADLTDLGDWSCGPPNPDNDANPLVGDPGQRSFISCFNGSGTGPSEASQVAHHPLARVTYNVPGGATAGAVPLVLDNVAVFDDSFTPLVNCVPGPCADGQITLTDPPTAAPTDTPVPATDTPIPTDTPVPPTATLTNTPTATPEGAFLYKVPEQCSVGSGGDASDDNADCSGQIPLANLWLCEVGPCDGQGEGNLIVFEYATGITDSPEPGIQGLGAYEFSVEYDNFVIQSVNPCDVVFGTASADPNNPGGSDGLADGAGQNRGPVDELDTSSGNPYCDNDAATAPATGGNGTCAYSIVLENIVHFGCVTSGVAPAGPQGSMDIAALNLIPHGDLRNDIFPGNNNGVVTILKDNGCELVDTLGHPVPGSVNGGLTVDCGDLAVTVRILEGDLDLDCDVDLTDAQTIAAHYGAFFGGLLYSKWLDLEPQYHDLDIDIKDIQKVFGRIGSDCQAPVPAQPPVPYN
jgi:hypothetical protein